MKKRNVFINVLIFVLILLTALYWKYYSSKEFQRSEFLLDTIVEISVTSRESNVNSIIDSAFDLMRDYEYKLSMYKEDGQIWEINNSSVMYHELDNDLYSLLELSQKLYGLSDSLYDITIGSLSEIWDFENQYIPSLEEIDNALEYVGFNKISFDTETLSKPPGIKLNLGSLAKGFIVDKAVEFLINNDIKAGIINAGGDLRIFGYDDALSIGIQHPRGEKNDIISVLNLKNNAVVTSGDYERFFIYEGKRYHHILNPKTGFPSSTAVSVTVISNSTMIADALSTVLFLLHPEEALSLLDVFPESDAIIFYMEKDELKQIHSEGFTRYMRSKDER